LTVSIGNQIVALCIDAHLSGDVTLSASRMNLMSFAYIQKTIGQ